MGGMPSKMRYDPGRWPGGLSTTRGARSRKSLSMRSTHRSPGSLTCESAEISFSSATVHLLSERPPEYPPLAPEQVGHTDKDFVKAHAQPTPRSLFCSLSHGIFC